MRLVKLIGCVLIVHSVAYGQITNSHFSGACSGANMGIPSSSYTVESENPAWLNSNDSRLSATTMFGDYSNTATMTIYNIKDLSVVIPFKQYGVTSRLFYGQPIHNRIGNSYLEIGKTNAELVQAGAMTMSYEYHFSAGNIIQNNTLRLGLTGAYLIKGGGSQNSQQFSAGAVYSVRPLRSFQLSAGSFLQKDTKSFLPDILGFDGQIRYFPDKYSTASFAVSGMSKFGLNLSWLSSGAAISYSTGNYQPVSGTVGYHIGRADPLHKLSDSIQWLTMGFSFYLHSMQIAFSYWDAIDLKENHFAYKGNKTDFGTDARYISMGLSVPVGRSIRFLKEKNTFKPQFLHFQNKNHAIHLGQQDTLELWFTGESMMPIKQQFIYMNVEPKYGVVLGESNQELKNLLPGEENYISIPIQSLANFESQQFQIAIESPYHQDQTLKTEIPFSTVGPSFLIGFDRDLQAAKKFYFIKENNAYIFDMTIYNNGSTYSEGLKIYVSFDEENEVYIQSDTVKTGQIKPGEEKKARLYVRTNDTNLPPRIHYTIYFNEKNGFDPVQFDGDFFIKPDNQLTFRMKQFDPFVQKFAGYRNFIAVFQSNLEDLGNAESLIQKYNLKPNPRFPGYLVATYHLLSEAMTALNDLNKEENFLCMYAEKDGIYTLANRFFLAVENTPENESALIEMDDNGIFDEKGIAKKYKILWGPFMNIEEALVGNKYIKPFIQGEIEIVRRYAHEVTAR
jgi:hypothetical protein